MPPADIGMRQLRRKIGSTEYASNLLELSVVHNSILRYTPGGATQDAVVYL